MTVYISGALMSAKNLETNRKIYFELAEICKDLNFAPYLPHLNCDPINNNQMSSEAVFKKDLKHLESSDIILAYLDDPSLGVGAEIALAHFYKKIIIGLHHKNIRVSRFVMGIIESSPNSFVVEYTTSKNLKLKTQQALKKLNEELSIQTV